jgi:hypothetical protein
MGPALAAHWNSFLKTAVRQLAIHFLSKAIEIPTGLRNQPLDAWQTSARLSAVLDRCGIRVLGDLRGRKVVDFAWEKNCGPKTLYELDLLARRARFQNGKASWSGHGRYGHASHMVSQSFNATGSEEATAKTKEDAASFAIPESISHLSFQELPITTRLANVVLSIGARTLGDLDGLDAFELLQYKGCGWSTISEIQHLIERAVFGEFDVAQIEEATAVAELLSLLEQGLAQLSLRDRQFVVAGIGGEMRGARSPGGDFLCPSYAEIGRRYRLTRACVHKVFTNSLHTLRKIWGPRVPRLLEVLKWRCLSMTCPLTPELLAIWRDSASISLRGAAKRDCFGSFQLTTQAQVRLIAALDKSIPCWLSSQNRRQRAPDSVRPFDLALAHVVRESGGEITVAEAYRKLANTTGRDYRGLTIDNFLRILPAVEYTIVEFKDPQAPTIRMAPSNGEAPGVQLGSDQLSVRRETNSKSIPFSGTKSTFREHNGSG